MPSEPYTDDGESVKAKRRGRPCKEAPSGEERIKVNQLREQGWNWDVCAVEVSSLRAEKHETVEAKNRCRVSGQWLRKHMTDGKKQDCAHPTDGREVFDSGREECRRCGAVVKQERDT